MEITETLELNKKHAEKITNEIEKEFDSLKSLNLYAKKITSEISVNHKHFNKNISSLNSIVKNTDDAIDRFNKEKIKISNLLKQADNFYEKQYIPLKEKIDNSNTGFKAKISESNSLFIKLKSNESECSKKYEEIKLISTDFKKTIRELRNIDSAIRKLHTNTAENKSKSEINLTKILNIENDSNSLLLNISELEKKSSTLFDSITTLEKNSNDKFAKIENHLNSSNEILSKIEEIYGLSADTVRSGEFKNRRDDLKDEVKKWGKYVLYISIFFLVSVTGFFVFQLWLNDWKITNLQIDFYLRFLLLSPIVYYLYFCSDKHNKAQKLYDKYNFKTTLAMSIQHHIDVLMKQDKFTQNGQLEKVLDFILIAFNKIYNEPYSDEDYTIKLKLSNIELELEKKMYEILKSEK